MGWIGRFWHDVVKFPEKDIIHEATIEHLSEVPVDKNNKHAINNELTSDEFVERVLDKEEENTEYLVESGEAHSNKYLDPTQDRLHSQWRGNCILRWAECFLKFSQVFLPLSFIFIH